MAKKAKKDDDDQKVEERVEAGVKAGIEKRRRILEDKLDRQEIAERRVVLKGLAPIMFDRYPGENKTELEWYQKLYLAMDGKTICLPALNIMSFLSARNTTSAPKRLLDARHYITVCNACLSSVVIVPTMIPFMRDGAPIELHEIKKDRDPVSGVQLHIATARLEKGVPNPKKRPVLPLPWSLEFDLDIIPPCEITEQQVRFLFEVGGRAIGFGTFRGVFGKFMVETWEPRSK
jgi:hypothetical protein